MQPLHSITQFSSLTFENLKILFNKPKKTLSIFCVLGILRALPGLLPPQQLLFKIASFFNVITKTIKSSLSMSDAVLLLRERTVKLLTGMYSLRNLTF